MGDWDEASLERAREMLVDEIGELGAKGGAIGGGLGAGLAGRGGGERGGRRGARRGARRMREDRDALDLELELDPRAAADDVTAALENRGNVVEGKQAAAGGAEIWGVMGVGLGGLNPVVVRAQIAPRGERSTRVTINTIAKEGLIKQRAAKKAARELREALTPGSG